MMGDIKKKNVSLELSLLCTQLLEDIKIIRPSRSKYYFEMFDKLLNGKWFEDYVLTYDDKNMYELVYYERGTPVGGIKGDSVDEFRFCFLRHEFFLITYDTAKDDIENMIAELYSLFDNKSVLEKHISEYQKMYKLGTFDFATMKFSN